ncbi:hypothetical protein Back11_23110 [Paenibacillus baekrokdamisoli]|uniref:Uncharacterized protein n=1 Tax=Paenibacillus baekrokdamisoli TaxID=1712516 RepID=A0A3G9IRD7_9BACL|nr:sporulation protein YpjB [Paenibacillus baekrokdamisoli]MBB3069680.1 hypothetical protein [Paenibacillus baekrokdamisoli]BBH20966.1 hypothetical protein Back11_23110 [Paenibacillus baekrokdamisoli]
MNMSMSNKPSAFFIMLAVIVVLSITAGCSYDSNPAAVFHDEQSAALHMDKSYVALTELNRLSEELYSASNKGNRQLAYTILGHLEKASALPSVRQQGTPQGWIAFDKSLKEVKQVLSQTGSSRDWYMQAARIKLASDALIRPEAGLWLQYEDILGDDESRMRQAWQSQRKGYSEETLISLRIYNEHLQRFEVAALMQRDASLLLGLRNQLVYTEQLIRHVEKEGKTNATSIPQAFQNLILAQSHLFQGDHPSIAAQSDPRVMMPGGNPSSSEQLAILYISAIVMSMLALVGWRRFAYERRHGSPYSPANGNKKRR